MTEEAQKLSQKCYYKMGYKQKNLIYYPEKKGGVELIRFKVDLKIFSINM